LSFAACEWGDPYGSEIQELKHFAVELRPELIDGQVVVRVEFGPFSGDPDYQLGPKAYPLVDALMVGNHDETRETLEEVFAAEMARVRDLKPPDQTEAVMDVADAPLPKA